VEKVALPSIQTPHFASLVSDSPASLLHFLEGDATRPVHGGFPVVLPHIVNNQRF
jgi:hypothetical protein